MRFYLTRKRNQGKATLKHGDLDIDFTSLEKGIKAKPAFKQPTSDADFTSLEKGIKAKLAK